jgi:hypothetical protein
MIRVRLIPTHDLSWSVSYQPDSDHKAMRATPSHTDTSSRAPIKYRGRQPEPNSHDKV